MAFYDLPKSARQQLTEEIRQQLLSGLLAASSEKWLPFFGDGDTYVRKSAYLALGRLYLSHPALNETLLKLMQSLRGHPDPKIRQTVINAAGEIGKSDFSTVQDFFDSGLTDSHHVPRNAVIGSVKKMGEVNPIPVLAWARTYLRHPDKEIRREICHGIELRGRKYPQDILPLLRELENDKTTRVRNTLVHVLGQIAYKKGCLETVLADLLHWKNRPLVEAALGEIISVHGRYRNFAHYTTAQAREVIGAFFPEFTGAASTKRPI